MTDRAVRALSFDKRAASYSLGHPGYPEALVDEILRFSGIPAEGKILEIGAGSAQATLPFSRRGFYIKAVEPGQDMIAFAKQRLGEGANVDFVNDTFDQWPLEREAYDLVIAGRALNWVGRKIRFTKTADALRAGGCLAVFRNAHIPGDQAMDRELRSLIEKYRPFRAQRRFAGADKQFVTSKHYEPVVEKVFHWERVCDAKTFIESQKVRMEYHRLTDEQRRELFESMHDVVMRHGGTVCQKFDTILLIARKRQTVSWARRFFSRK